MKAQTLRNLVDGHGWIGLFISIPLFIVFWAGSITFFQPEVYRWASTVHFPVAEGKTEVKVDALIDRKLAQYNVDKSSRIFITYPSEYSPYLRLGFYAFAPSTDASKAGQDKPRAKYTALLIDPNSGETLTDQRPFELSDFFYRLHYNLKLPQGDYVVGFITLFFMMLLMTGLVIQLKNLIKHFFLYRADRNTRYKMNDLHNVVGVVTLPYGLMFALTGLMFNLNIIAQLPTVAVLYKGDINAAFKDAGTNRINPEFLDKPQAMPSLDKLVAELEQQEQVDITGITLYNYGDKSAVIRFRGQLEHSFANHYARYYEVDKGQFPAELNSADDNVFANGTRLLYRMHFADFAGVDVRFIFFILGLGVCAMIVAGNVLWLVKRQKRNATPKTISIMRALTLGGCAGVIPATALSFLLERSLPLELSMRGDMIEYGFGIGLFIAVIAAFRYQEQNSLLRHYALSGAMLFAITAILDWVLFAPALLYLIEQGSFAALSVNIALLLVSFALAWFSYKLTAKAPAETEQEKPVKGSELSQQN